MPFAQADLLYLASGRPNFELLNPIENCTGGKNRSRPENKDTNLSLIHI